MKKKKTIIKSNQKNQHTATYDKFFINKVSEKTHTPEEALTILLEQRNKAPFVNEKNKWFEINEYLPPIKSIQIMTFERNSSYVIHDCVNSWAFLQHYLLNKYYYTDKTGWSKRISHFMILGEPDVDK